MEYEIPTWRDYQHYKDRDPPWIKLHFSLLTSPTWVMLDDASRVLAVACMLIASRNHGKVPANPAYIKRVAYLKSVDFKPLLSIKFLVPCKQLLADDSNTEQEQAKATTEESRGETETEKTDCRFADFWVLYPRKEAKAKASSAWKSAKADKDFDRIAAALARLKTSEQWTKDGGKFIPHASTWINQRRWEDEPTQVAEASNIVPLQKQAWICAVCGQQATRKQGNDYYCQSHDHTYGSYGLSMGGAR